MATKFQVQWDNGFNACGTFPQQFDTEGEAQAFADNWANERNLEDLGMTPEQVEAAGGDGCYTSEVVEVQVSPDPDPEELLIREPWE
jgi:hypothetical protein